MLREYVFKVHELLEKPRNELERKYANKKDKRMEELIRKYDEALMEKYKYIEKLMAEELSDME